jgi:hypothetical protein
MKNETQRRIHKYFFSHYFCFVFFSKNIIRGNAATNNTPNEGGRFHRVIIKEVEMLQYSLSDCENEFRTKYPDNIQDDSLLTHTVEDLRERVEEIP